VGVSRPFLLDEKGLEIDFSDEKKKLGEGGCGEVWLCTYGKAITCAVKIVKKSAGPVSREETKDFLDEIRLHRC
jgi:hypothetical protein